MSSGGDKKEKKVRKQNPLVTGYLLLYNFACCAGWAGVLFISLKHIANKTTDSLYADVELPLKIVQTAACLEILHAMVGLVKSPWFTTFLQVFSRVWVVWAVMHVAPPAQTSIFTVLTIVSWSLVEIPRYSFYALNLVNAVPYPLFWLRYSLFAILYPTGISGELGCMYYGGIFIRDSNLFTWTPIPGVTLSLFHLIVLVALTYIPGAPKMYGYMVKTRKKQFQEYAAGAAAKAK